MYKEITIKGRKCFYKTAVQYTSFFIQTGEFRPALFFLGIKLRPSKPIYEEMFWINYNIEEAYWTKEKLRTILESHYDAYRGRSMRKAEIERGQII